MLGTGRNCKVYDVMGNVNFKKSNIYSFCLQACELFSSGGKKKLVESKINQF